jgi:hypothetical protein
VLLTRLPLGIATSFDLHVLGTPPALVLSQDQTLHKNFYGDMINMALYFAVLFQMRLRITSLQILRFITARIVRSRDCSKDFDLIEFTLR